MIRLRILRSLLLSPIFLVACAGPEVFTKPQSAKVFDARDDFTEERPKVICGQEGHRFLWQQHFRPFCMTCHADGLFLSPIASADANIAYGALLAVNPDRLIQGLIQNRFCGEKCSTISGSEKHKAVLEWLSMPTDEDCPE